MRFVTYQLGRKSSAGILRGPFVYDLAQAFFRAFRRPYRFYDLLDFLEADGMGRIGEVDFNGLKEDRLVCIPSKEVRFLAPLPRPPKIICVGLNYRDHAQEQKLEPPKAPLLFAKASTVVIGDEDEIRIPHGISDKIDYEVELAAVIGTRARGVRREEAGRFLFGYTVFNDVTARDLQSADKQWFRAKSFDTFGPMGPMVVTPEEIDANNAELELLVNGRTMQKGTTSQMVFDVAAIIEYASACFTLEVGDVIATGTPAGVGVFRTPPAFLKPGDRVEARIAGIGGLTNTVR